MFKKGNSINKGRVPWNLGKKHSPESIKKMRLRKLGKVMPPETGEKIRRHHLGKKHSIESCQKRSEALRGRPRPYLMGENNPAWKGGTTTLGQKIRGSIGYETFRQKVFKRDDWVCQLCLIRGGDLHVDHIKPFSLIVKEEQIKTFFDIQPNSQLWDTKNGRTLCVPCHRNTETYGFKATFYQKI